MDTEEDYNSDSNVQLLECNKKSQKNSSKLPRSAFALYIRLYCSRKDTKSLKHTSKMIEATKSWLTLNDIEKQKFHKKYKEYQEKYSDVLVNCLQKSKPFMKRKVSLSRIKNNDAHINEHLEEEENEPTQPHLETEVIEGNNYVNEEKDERSSNCDEIEREDNTIEDTHYEEDTLKQSKISYLEPMAPSLKTGKELFEIVQSNSENTSTWSALPQRERSLYNKAILTIKKDYIHKYKLYLENLSDKELFDHYNKCFK